MATPREVTDWTWYEVDVTDKNGCINGEEITNETPSFDSMREAKKYANDWPLEKGQVIFISENKRTILKRIVKE